MRATGYFVTLVRIPIINVKIQMFVANYAANAEAVSESNKMDCTVPSQSQLEQSKLIIILCLNFTGDPAALASGSW